MIKKIYLVTNQIFKCIFEYFYVNISITPTYTTTIVRHDNGKKYIIVKIEMPPVSNKDKEEILKCTSIFKSHNLRYKI